MAAYCDLAYLFVGSPTTTGYVEFFDDVACGNAKGAVDSWRSFKSFGIVAKYVLTDRSQTLGDPRIVSAIAPPPAGVDVSTDCAVPRGRGTYFQNALRPDRDPSAPSSESSSMLGSGAVRRPKKEYSIPKLPAEMTAEELSARPFLPGLSFVVVWPEMLQDLDLVPMFSIEWLVEMVLAPSVLSLLPGTSCLSVSFLPGWALFSLTSLFVVLVDESRYPLPARPRSTGIPLRREIIGSFLTSGLWSSPFPLSGRLILFVSSRVGGTLSCCELPCDFLPELGERCPVVNYRAIRRQAPGQAPEDHSPIDEKYYAALRIGNLLLFIYGLPCSQLFIFILVDDYVGRGLLDLAEARRLVGDSYRGPGDSFSFVTFNFCNYFLYVSVRYSFCLFD